MKEEINAQAIFLDKMLLPKEIDLVVLHSLNVLLERYSAVEGYVILAQMEKIVEQAKEALKERAIAKVSGKEELIMGAKVSLRRSVAWEYDSPTLARLDVEKTSIAEKIKAHKNALESGATVVSDEGQIETAKKTKDGITIAVSLPKGK